VRTALTSHIRQLNYRGHICIKTELVRGSVTIYSPHWTNRLRNNGIVFWTCILTQLWILTWPILWLLERRYEIVSSEWLSSTPGTGALPIRHYARDRDEASLADYWAPAVKQAAWSRRCNNEMLTPDEAQRLQGLRTEQLLTFHGTEFEHAERTRRERLARGDGTFVDSFVGVARGVSEVSQGWSMAMGWGGDR
jgi:hypothetical protein